MLPNQGKMELIPEPFHIGSKYNTYQMLYRLSRAKGLTNRSRDYHINILT